MKNPSSSDDPASVAMSRRTLLGGIASLGGAMSLAQCSGGGGSSTLVPATASAVVTPTTASATATATAIVTATPSATPGVHATATALATATASPSSSASTAACAISPEGEIGPFFADDSASGFNRSNVVANVDGSSVQTGVPFTLNIYVVDTENGCKPYSGAQVDIWHCNTAGVYSDIASQGTSTQSWLRGYQLTNSAGYVQFTTIMPGWYQGRTTHIHVRVRSSYSEASSTSDGTNTTQVFFPQTTIDYLSTSVAPYSSEGINPTTNAEDRVYSMQTLGKTLLTLSGSYSSGFSATYTVGLPIGG